MSTSLSYSLNDYDCDPPKSHGQFLKEHALYPHEKETSFADLSVAQWTDSSGGFIYQSLNNSDMVNVSAEVLHKVSEGTKKNIYLLSR